MSNRRKLVMIAALSIVIITIMIYFNINKTEFISKKPTTRVNTGNLDNFGILEIYLTKVNGREWFIDMNNPTKDGIFNPQSDLIKQSDGSWQVAGGPNLKKNYNQVRMQVTTPKGQEEWKNVEMTGYVKVVYANTSSDSLIWYARGGKHSNSYPCEGSSLKGRLTVDGKALWAKEIWHTGGYTNHRGKIQATDSIIGRWIGWKVTMFNINNNTAVRMQSFIDNEEKNNWLKVTDIVDDGGWYSKQPDAVFYSADCGKAKDYIIKNGGPIATFRSDNIVWNFKNLSVREIKYPEN